MTKEIPTKGKPGNRRLTGRGYRGQKGGAHVIEWKRDPIILYRISIGMVPYLERRSAAECLEIVNRAMAKQYPDEPPISIDTIYEDRKRGLILRREKVVDPIDEHLAEYDHAIQQAWVAFRDTKSQSLNRSAFISTIGNLVEKKAKLDRSLAPENLVNIVIQHAEMIVKVFANSLDDPEWGLDDETRAKGRLVLQKHMRLVEG